MQEIKTLVGLVVDVSGSMETSIRNETDGELSRFESFQRALNRLLDEARNVLRSRSSKEKIDSPIDLFIYCFGLKDKIIEVADLLTLMKMGGICIREFNQQERQRGVKAQVSSQDEIRQRVSQRIRQKIERLSIDVMHQRSMSLAMQAFSQPLPQEYISEFKNAPIIGDTTLSIDEVTNTWSQSDIFLQIFEDMIYGGTPMCKALNIVRERFRRELSGHKDKRELILFLLSDGEPTDGNPLSIAREIKTMGVSIICCLIDNKDIIDPQILFNQPNPSWNNNACLMFEMASEIEEESHFARFLLKKGWTINSQAKMFVQLNHSKVLEEFIQIIFSPLDQEISDLIPRGD